jgi:drug/metabolite transporter (DMT)-like permease
MKPQVIAGIALAAVGVFLMLRGFNFGSQRSTVRVGEFQASVEERRAIPPWVGGVAVLGGLLLVGTSRRRQRGA